MIPVNFEAPRIGKFIHMESGMVVARGWRRGRGELAFDGERVLSGEDEEVLEMMLVMAAQQCECL